MFSRALVKKTETVGFPTVSTLSPKLQGEYVINYMRIEPMLSSHCCHMRMYDSIFRKPKIQFNPLVVTGFAF